MRQAFKAAIWCAGLALFGVPFPDAQAQQPPAAVANTQATRQYYTALIAGSQPNLAGLTLMMTAMPKGGDLHHHYSGAIYAETFLDWVKLKGFCIYRVDYAERRVFKFNVEAKPGDLPPEQRANCLDVDAVLSSANNAFYRDLLSTWSDKDFSNHSHQQSAPDQHFFDTFFYIGRISTEYPDLGLRQLKARAIAENVQYIETMLRSAPSRSDLAPLDALNRLTSASTDGDVQAALAPQYDFLVADQETRDAVEAYVKTMESAADGIDDEQFKLRFQAYVSRNDPPAKVFAGLYAAFAAANAGGRVVGVNIVGPENGPVAMRDYSLHMRLFAFLREKFPKVRLSLHAGELALGMVPPEGLQSHIREAVEIAGASRLGHAVDVAHERDASGLLRLLREKKVAVEINLTSNDFILGVKGEAHPVLLYRHAGVPFVISTDDAGVSRNNLSGEYVLYASRYKPTYDMLKETVFNSIRFSFLSDADKTAELAKLTQRFAQFEARMADLARGLPGPR
jgi:adenosine deaminase/adenosine deaminase CECR1